MKLATNVKVNPRHWDNAKQVATISNVNSRLDNRNNRIVNDRLQQIRTYYSEFIDYLCNQDITPVNLLEILRTFIYRNMGNKRQTIDAIKTIREAFKYYYSVIHQNKESSLMNTEKQLNRFISYLQEKNLTDSVEVFQQTGLNNYKGYLIDVMKREEKIGKSHINTLCQLIARLINNVLVVNDEYQKYNFSPVRYVKIEDKRQQDEIRRFPLYAEEIQAIKNCQNLTEKEREYRSIFLLQCASGQRISDILQIIRGNYSEKDGIITLQTIKKGTYSQIYLTDEVRDYLSEIRQIKLINLKKFDDNLYNKYLKEICQKSGLNREYKWKDSRGNDHVNPIWEIVVSHCARHTFATNKVKEGVPYETICLMTGHADDRMIKDVYANLTKEDKADKVRNYHKSVSETSTGKEKITSTITDVSEMMKPDKDVSIYEFDSDLVNPDMIEEITDNVDFSKRFNLTQSDIEFLSKAHFPKIEIGYHSVKLIKQLKRLMERGLIICTYKGNLFPDQLRDIKINPIYE